MLQISETPEEHTVLFSSQQTLIIDETSFFDAAPSVPLSIFANELSGLRALVRYLHEQGKLSFSEIGRLLNRSPKTIWTTYDQAKNTKFSVDEGGLRIPVAKLADRNLSLLETLVIHLASLGFSNVDVARILNKDPRTTWTLKKRAERKGVVLQ